MDEVFDALIGVCGELGAKMDDIDTLGYEIHGKFKTNWKTWGSKFHALRKDDMRFSGDERTMRLDESGDPMPGRGAPLIIAKKVCSKCGASNEPESAFCAKCGGPLN